MKVIQGAVTLTHYKQYVQYHTVRGTLEEVKVLIHYVEEKSQHTDGRTQPLNRTSLANHVGAVMNRNA